MEAKKTAEEMATELKTQLSSLETNVKELQEKETATPKEVKEATEALETFKTENEEALKAFVKTEDLGDIESRLKANEEDLETAKNELKEALIELKSISDKGRNSKGGERLKLDEETLAGIKKSLDDAQNRAFEFEIATKALVLASTAVNNNTYAVYEQGIDQIAHRKMTLLDVFKRVPLATNHSGTIRWREWDEATTAAVVTAIEEGAPFPESTVRWKEESDTVKKIGTSIPVTEEFGVDESTLYDEIETFFRDYVELFEEEQIYQGTNATGQLNGFHTQAPTYVPVAEGVQGANISDLTLSVKSDINRGKGSKINADTVVMNLATINTFLRTKATDNQYIWAPFVTITNGQIMVSDMKVIESNLVADNEMDVFDSTKATIFEYEAYKLTTGYVNNQFMEDESTLKARKRMLLRIKSNDLQAFRKVTDIAAALITIAS